jgi:hypothetical protein
MSIIVSWALLVNLFIIRAAIPPPVLLVVSGAVWTFVFRTHQSWSVVSVINVATLTKHRITFFSNAPCTRNKISALLANRMRCLAPTSLTDSAKCCRHRSLLERHDALCKVVRVFLPWCTLSWIAPQNWGVGYRLSQGPFNLWLYQRTSFEGLEGSNKSGRHKKDQPFTSYAGFLTLQLHH